MQKKLLEILVCPGCRDELRCEPTTFADDEIIEGKLMCGACDKEFPIVNGIPRFVPSENYASSFGMQWNMFKSEQVDHVNGFDISENRFYSVSEWERDWLRGKWILDAGCGAGRFLDVVSKNDIDVVGIDLSNAVDAAKSNLADRKNVHLVQASIYELPFREGSFDGVYCIGVVQHTPEPKKTLRSLAKMVKDEGGRLALFIYERKPWTMLYSKYLIRPLTTKLKQETLLSLIKGSMPVLFPLTEVTFRIPGLGGLFRFLIPVSNYVGINAKGVPGLNAKQRYQWAIMDTFDMLAPAYDQPQTMQEVEETLKDAGIENIRRTGGVGLCIDARKESRKSEVSRQAASV